MPLENIVVRGAREHNLKDIDVTIPRDKLVVITGVSGSGKSSLAFDTIYAEGQRRYVESLSAYARQFLGRMDKPEVDYIEGLSPAISIDQKGVSRNPRSTVGTVTEVYDYLRLLFARVGHPHCHSCGRPVESQTVQQMVDAIVDLPDRTRIQILAPMVRRRKGEHKEVFEDARRAGFVRVRVNGEPRDLSENIALQKTKWHDIEVIVDRLVIADGLEQSRVADSVEAALKLTGGTVLVNVVDGDDLLFSEQFACVHCNISLGEMEPRTFSFNNPHGACQRCSGLGYKLEVDPDLVIPNKDLSLVEGAIQPWMRSGTADTWMMSLLTAVAEEYGFSTREPLNRFTQDQLNVLLYGTGKSRVRVQHRTKRGRMHRWDTAFEGVVNNLERRYRQTESDMIRAEIERYMSQRACQNCQGQRLKPEALAVTIGGCNIIDVTSRSIEHALDWIGAIRGDADWRSNGGTPFTVAGKAVTPSDTGKAATPSNAGKAATPSDNGKAVTSSDNGKAVTLSDNGKAVTPSDIVAMSVRYRNNHVPPKSYDGKPIGSGDARALSEREMTIASQALKEIEARLRFLYDIGLDYLTLERTASSLSGGEAQRIRLATQIGSGLIGVLYVCDEPSIGLHPADDYRLIQTLLRLRDLGNTVLIVEHDEAIMRAADHIIDMGPGAGEHGGHIVATGPIHDIIETPESLTGQYLGYRKRIPLPDFTREGSGKSLIVRGARENNLKGIDVEIPLGMFVCITGVSGSGKSTLVNEILYKKLAQEFYRSRERPGLFDAIEGIGNVDKVVNIDQSPIGRTPRSNPATYTGTFTPMRELFATAPEARIRGYKPGRFSFNVKGGRCEACSGDGYNQIEMQFLPDVTVPCEVCNGARYNREALEIRWKGKNIAEVLDMTVTEALEHFSNIPRIRNKLQTMYDVGLGYIRLGQPATTLSGGEAQRVKLATELSKRATGQTLYILDEPTTGLSFEDCAYLLRVLHRLVDAGNTVVLIEHHLDLIKSADWLIDLGPGAGDRGGEIVAVGAPRDLADMDHSETGRYLRRVFADVTQSHHAEAAG